MKRFSLAKGANGCSAAMLDVLCKHESSRTLPRGKPLPVSALRGLSDPSIRCLTRPGWAWASAIASRHMFVALWPGVLPPPLFFRTLHKTLQPTPTDVFVSACCSSSRVPSCSWLFQRMHPASAGNIVRQGRAGWGPGRWNIDVEECWARYDTGSYQLTHILLALFSAKRAGPHPAVALGLD